MRRLLSVSASALAVFFITATGAMAWTLAPAHSTQVIQAQDRAARHTAKHRRRKHNGRTQAAVGHAALAGATLLGDGSVEPTLDSNAPGSAEAFPFTATASGSTAALSVYVDSHNSATKLIAGLYASNGGQPGSLLTSGSLSSPQAGSWNTVTVGATAVTAGHTYWLAVLGRGGTLYFRDRQGGPCDSVNSSQSTLRSLASTWSNGGSWNTCPVSAYASAVAVTQAAPVNTAAPALSGTPEQGDVMTSSTGAWSNSPSSYGYAWEDCSASGSSCTPIVGATSSSYTLQTSDIGDTVVSEVTATNAGGTATARSAASGVVTALPPSPPVNTAAPTISGTLEQGQTLSETHGTWTNSPTAYSYQWEDCSSTGTGCSPISGATGQTFTLTTSNVGQTIVVVETASNAAGAGAPAASVSSPIVAALPQPPASSALPAISGTSVSGQTLSVSNGSWTNSPTAYAYAWESCTSSGASCSTIAGATQAGYTIPTSEVGDTLRAVVTASNAVGSASATSAPSAVITAAVVAAPVDTAVPAISGTTTQGQTLTASTGTWSGSPTSYQYSWEDCGTSGSGCTPIEAATSSSYSLQSSDVGSTVRVIVTAANAGGSASADSAATATIAAAPTAPADTAAPTISGSAQEGQTLTANAGTWSGTTPMTHTYQWQRNGTTNISGATGATYTVGSADVGTQVDVVVTTSNAVGDASATSAETSTVTASSSGSLPSGVTLQQIDGGANYFGKWSNSFPTSSSFYPIGVFDQGLGYDSSSGTWDASQLAAYKAVGINTFVNLYNGYNSGLISALKADGMYALGGPLDQGYEGNTLAGYVWFDEADGNNDCGDVPSASVLGATVPCSATSDGRTPASAIQQVNEDLNAKDPTRPVYCQYTKPVAELSGLSTASAAAYVNADCGIVSYDSYIISDGWATNHDLWRQYDDVANVRSLANDSIPVMPFIEAGEPFTSDQWSGVTDTPAMSVAEAWNAIIAGARGIQWFDHDFGGSAAGYAESSDDLIDSNSVFASLQSAVSAFDARVKSLAPIINDPFANGFMTSVSNPNPDSEDGRSANVMVKYDAASNDFYVFVAPTSNNAQTLTFTTAGGYSGPVTVQGESRTVTATNGTFSDTFSGQTAVHIYIVPNS